MCSYQAHGAGWAYANCSLNKRVCSHPPLYVAAQADWRWCGRLGWSGPYPMRYDLPVLVPRM